MFQGILWRNMLQGPLSYQTCRKMFQQLFHHKCIFLFAAYETVDPSSGEKCNEGASRVPFHGE